jgi:hypothetical protein
LDPLPAARSSLVVLRLLQLAGRSQSATPQARWMSKTAFSEFHRGQNYLFFLQNLSSPKLLFSLSFFREKF